jgi:pimeloyl-ACP methyl ester carboxylesterase
MAELYCHKAGAITSPAIVFLHGGGLSGRMWQPQIEHLSEFHCLVPDLPEHGRSAARRPFTLARAAADVATLIREAVPSGRAYLVGLSIGGAVGLEVLRTQPEVVERALLSGATPKLAKWLVFLTDLIVAPLLRLTSAERLGALTLKSLGVPRQYHDLLSGDWRQLTPALYHHINKATGEVQLPTHPVPPTLLVVGQREPGISKVHARSVARAVPGATARLVSGVGHAWNLEAPDLFNELVRAWFTERPLPAFLQSLT